MLRTDQVASIRPGYPGLLSSHIFPETARGLRARGLSKTFEAGVPGCSGRVRAITSVDLDLRPSEIIAIAGSAGSGKSTLLLLLAGALQLDSGRVEWLTDSGTTLRHPNSVEYLPAWRAGHALHSLRRAVASSPGILLVDDIFANLDAIARREARVLLRQLRGAGVSIILATSHDRECMALCTRVVSLRNGQADGRLHNL